MKNAYKKLGANMLLFAISSFGTKIIGFLLVPLYTNCLSMEEYGTVDMLYTIVQLAIPIFSVDIADGVIRFVLDKHNKDTSILLIAIKVISFGSLALLLLMFGFRAINLVVLQDKFYVFIFVNFLLTSLYNTFVNYLKGKERIKNLVIAGLMCSLLNAGCNILFLIKFGMGVDGYLMAHLIAIAVPMLYLFTSTWFYGYLNFKDVGADRDLEKRMLLYSAPLILNGLAWWANNSLDRLFVIFICGVSANGLLAVAYKIPSIMSMIQTIFNQAWSLSAIQEFDPEDRNGFMGYIYSYYGCAMTLSSSAILLINVLLAKLLYANDFFAAWQYTGMLIIAHLFGGLSVCLSGVFNAVKDTRTLAVTTMIGGLINAILNALFIPVLGVLGAVIATMVSNLVVWICRMRKVRSYIKIRINIKRDAISYILIVIQCLVGLSANHMYAVQLTICALIIILYKEEEILILTHAVKKMKSLRRSY
ncbi:oligosaccharide flippase family protein [Clostridium sp. MCC353]|uniref:lipopolysaccharide biosynthesis protein n=1 Tax=Clostridium sp. MCC353 TaxID=2592646 RepID=UPI001C02787D|nr:polysaccharide biosynthesis C-terminal domain-containing protein [Clostridium sp. MCC353]MBT9779475.1 oligosaccharide flippase family protein [Clostridium sp. MCC353]